MVVGYNQNYGWKTAFASPENVPTYLHAHKLMRKVWQGMPSRDDIGGDKWNQVADHCNTNFFHIDMERYTLESVLKKGAELVKRKGIKCLVIDPFNKVRDVDCKTEDVNRYTMEYLQKIEIFAKKFELKNLRCIISKAVVNGMTLVIMAYWCIGIMKKKRSKLRCLR
jgi:twinkle protein